MSSTKLWCNMVHGTHHVLGEQDAVGQIRVVDPRTCSRAIGPGADLLTYVVVVLSAVNVDLATAARIVAAVHAEAARRSVLVSAAVVDAGGHLVAFGRMDGAEIAGPGLAVDKAFTAVANRLATSELAHLAAPGGELFGLHANGGGRFVVFGGGVPILVEGDVVGGVGVSGASAADDDACARAGVAVVNPS